jgi:hypothetical protein
MYHFLPPFAIFETKPFSASCTFSCRASPLSGKRSEVLDHGSGNLVWLSLVEVVGEFCLQEMVVQVFVGIDIPDHVAQA